MKNLLRFYNKYTFLIILILIFLFAQAMCELALPGYMADIINKGIITGDMAYIFRVGVTMILVSCIGVICAVTGGFFSANVAARTAKNMRKSLFEKVLSFSSAEFHEFSTASLITRSTNDIQIIQQATVMLLRMACLAPIMGIGGVIKAFNTSISLTWTIALAVGAIIVVMAFGFFLVLPKFKVLQEKLDALNLIIKERLSGVLVVRAFTQEEEEEKRFEEANIELTKLNMFVNKAMSFLMPILFFIMNAVSIIILWAGSKLIETNNLMVGDMLAYLQYAMQIIMAFLFITMMFIMIPRAAVSAHRVGKVLGKGTSIDDSKNPTTIEKNIGRIEFRNVDFAYPDSNEKTLEGISFVAEPGKTTAIVGGTGSGKSTILNLILRFYDVTKGEILLDGIDIREILQKDLRDNIGYVPQKGILFSGTIESNMRFGSKEASKQEIASALKIAQAEEFINMDAEGLDREVAQGGNNISGGQKQRLSIARALVKRPNIYLFDDSFSALDFKTDKALRNGLKEEVDNATFFIVAQRINTIMDADQIIVLDDGKMVGIGRHEDLLRTNAVYKEIALSQLSAHELERGAI